MSSVAIPILIGNDLEYTGNKITRNSVISWGSAVFNCLTGEIVETDLVLFNKPYDACWEPSTYEWAKKNIPDEVKRLENTKIGHGKYTGTMLKVEFFNKMIQKYTNNDRALVTFASDTSGSDNSFMNQYLSLIDHQPIQTWFGCDYHKDPICIDTWYRGLLRLDILGKYNEIKLLREKYKIPDETKSDVQHDHNPVNDCIHMLKEYWIIKQAIEKADNQLKKATEWSKLCCLLHQRTQEEYQQDMTEKRVEWIGSIVTCNQCKWICPENFFIHPPPHICPVCEEGALTSS